LRTAVRGIARTADHAWQLTLDTPTGERESLMCDGLIVAVGAPAAASLLAPVDARLAAALARIEYAGTAIVTLAFPRSQVARLPMTFGFVVPAVEKRRILAASFASEKFPGRAPDDAVLVRVFLGGACQAELVELSDHKLIEIAREELHALIGAQGEPLLADVVRWRAAMPQYHLGHCDLVAEIERAASQWPALALAGNAYHGVGIPHCVRSGEVAAEQVAQALPAIAMG
jgi:oxygen-dependent protoporphyrinogen oxidase